MAIFEGDKMKPIVVLPVGAVSKRDIKRLNDNGVCTIEAKDPSMVRFIEPPPQGYDTAEWAAIELFRIILAPGANNSGTFNRQELGKLYADIIIRGMRPKPAMPIAKVEKAKS